MLRYVCVCDITAKTVRKLKWWNRIAGVVAKRKTSQKRNLFLRVFNMHFWNPTAIKQGSQWKWSAKRHHHDINMWQMPSSRQDENHNEHENCWKRWADFRAVRKFQSKCETLWHFFGHKGDRPGCDEGLSGWLASRTLGELSTGTAKTGAEAFQHFVGEFLQGTAATPEQVQPLRRAWLPAHTYAATFLSY